jgi:uncharacterized protein (TIGR04255 family)
LSLDFGPHDDVVYGLAPLRSVLAQVQFDPIFALFSQAGAAGFQEAIRSKYPRAKDPEQRTGISVEGRRIGVEQTPPVWRFTTEDDQWTVGLCVNFISLETPSYTRFEDFLERFTHLLHVLEKTLMPSSSTRIGLRKINAVAMPDPSAPHSLAERIRPEFLGPVARPDYPTALVQSLGQLQFDEDMNHMVVRHYLDGTDQQAFFVLDTDYFTDMPHEISGRGPIIDLLHHFSRGLTSFFEWVLQPAYKATLQPTPRGGQNT